MTRTAFVVIVGVWLISLVLWLTPGIVRPDGAAYLVYLPSTWLDGDLLFFDEWEELGMIREGTIHHHEITRTGHVSNHWPVGTAVFWYPAFVIADFLRPLTPFPRNGLSLPYNVALIFTSAVSGLLVMLVGFPVARLHASAHAALVAAVATWLGTPLLWYSMVHGTMAHAVSALTCALVVSSGIAMRQNFDKSVSLLTGLAAGLAFAVRPQNAPFALLPLLLDRRALSLPYVVGGLLGALPQLVISTVLYGSPLGFMTGPYAAFERVWTWEPILSWYHGLIPWSPVAALGLAGIVVLFRADRKLAGALMFVFLAEWIINATMERTFWGAHSFGARRFDNCTMVFLIGAAVFVDRVGKFLGIALAATASLWTMSLFLAARKGMDLGTYYTPSELLALQIDALRSVKLGTFIGQVPPDARSSLVLIVVACTAIAIVAALVVRAMPTGIRASLVVGYVFALSLLFVVCGRRDLERVEMHAAFIERTRQLPGTAREGRLALLEDELYYLEKSGRHAAALRTTRDIAALRSGSK